jgi:hypothetical protein
MIPTHPSKRREPVKIIGDHKFYQINLADELLHSRFMVAEIQELFLRHGISEGFLREVCGILKDQAIEERDPKKLRENVIAVAQNLEGRLGMLAEKRAYEELACVYFLMDDEPAEYDEAWQEKKKAVWRSAGESDFFIGEAFKHMNASANISMSDILAVWMAVKERHEQLPTLPGKSKTTSRNGTI